MNVNDDGDEDDVESTYRMMMTRKGVAGSERLCVGEKGRKKERKKERKNRKGGRERERKKRRECIRVCMCVREKAKKKEMRFGTRALYLYV